MPRSVGQKSKPKQKSLDQILIAEGFVANETVLKNNRTLEAPADLGDPWDLPSRLLRRPLEVQVDKNGVWQIGLLSPALRDHPFVRRVAAAIKPYRIGRHGAPNVAGSSSVSNAQWWHAVDLIHDHWKDLVRTRDYTTYDDIVRAVIYGLDYRHKSNFDTDAARYVLEEVQAAPPEDPKATVMLLMAPSLVKPDRGAPYWPINHTRSTAWEALAWIRVWGIEANWFGYSRSDHLGWLPKGQAMYAAIKKTTRKKPAAKMADAMQEALKLDEQPEPTPPPPDEAPAAEEEPPPAAEELTPLPPELPPQE